LWQVNGTKVRAIRAGEELVTTGLVLQELLQGFSGPRSRTQILDRFAALPLLVPGRRDHVGAAELRNKCRRGGIKPARSMRFWRSSVSATTSRC
jgi:predicted nucleic acid-binding protein